MAHIAGVELPRNKRVVIGLTYVYGIGQSKAKEILGRLSIDENKKVQDLSTDEEKLLRDLIQNEYVVEGDLRTTVSMNIKRLIEIGSYRGLRHKKSLPLRGQRTKTNARTRKGPKPGAIKKKKK